MNTIVANGEAKPKSRRDKRDDVRIAIVEDDPMYRNAIEYYLKSIPGSRLFSFGSGEECLRYYHLLDPEIMILDYRIDETPGSDHLNGIEIMQQIKSVHPETEVVFLSGQDNLDVATLAMKVGASEYIFKDFNALHKLHHVVAQMSLFVRFKRQEMKQSKWILFLVSFMALVMLFGNFSGQLHFSNALNAVMISVGVGSILFLIISRRKRKYFSHEPSVNSANIKEEIWHD